MKGVVLMKHLPAYPLVTVDPYISIWSMKHKKLYKDNTRMWAGYQKCLHGLMMIDDKPYRFMGENGVHHICLLYTSDAADEL